MVCIVLALAILCAIVWYVVFQEDRRGLLTVSFLDVGQGDSIFIDAPSGAQVIIDGGRTPEVLRKLAQAMPWYDRSIDLMIATHPDADHVGGLIDVLERYRVGAIVHSSVEGDTAIFAALQRAMKNENARVISADRGQIFELGRGAYVEILSPDREVPRVETNTGCVVARLVYGETAFMFSCDAPESIEEYVVRAGAEDLRSDVLKAGHHGSKTSSSPLFVGYVSPKFAVFSRGCDNSYGHPSPETVDTFARFGVPTFDTCTEGTVRFVSDGSVVTKK